MQHGSSRARQLHAPAVRAGVVRAHDAHARVPAHFSGLHIPPAVLPCAPVIVHSGNAAFAPGDGNRAARPGQPLASRGQVAPEVTSTCGPPGQRRRSQALVRRPRVLWWAGSRTSSSMSFRPLW